MKKIFTGFLTFVIGAYAALSIVNVFAFTEPSQNPPEGNVTPNFSGISIDDGRFTLDHNNGVTTIGGNSLFIFDRQSQFNNGLGLTDGILHVNDDGIGHADRRDIFLRDPLDVRGSIANKGAGNGGAVTIDDDIDARGVLKNSGNANGGAVTVNDNLNVIGDVGVTGALEVGSYLQVEGDSASFAPEISASNGIYSEGPIRVTVANVSNAFNAQTGMIRLQDPDEVARGAQGQALLLDDHSITTTDQNLDINVGNGERVTIGESIYEPGLTVWGNTLLKSDKTVNMVGGSNLNRAILNIQNEAGTRALALDGIHIQSHGGQLFLNAADNSNGITVGGLNSDVDLTINRGDILFEDGGNAPNGGIRFQGEGHFYSGSNDDFVFHSTGGADVIIDGGGTVGRFYSRLSGQTNVAGGTHATASSLCDAGDVRVSCGFNTQQSVWVVPNGSWPGGVDEPITCYAKITNRHAADVKWFQSRAYCFSPNG